MQGQEVIELDKFLTKLEIETPYLESTLKESAFYH